MKRRPSLPYSASTEVSAKVSSLTTGTTYHYRVVVENANGIKYGADQTYTPQQVLGLSTDPATNLTESSAKLNGSFVGNGEDTSYYFEWGPTTAYGNKTAIPPGTDAGSPPGPARTPLSFELSGLSPYTHLPLPGYRQQRKRRRRRLTARIRCSRRRRGPHGPRMQSASEVHSDRAILQRPDRPQRRRHST